MGPGRVLFIALALGSTVAFGLGNTSAPAGATGTAPLVLHQCNVGGYPARCGTLMVPEDRLSGKGRQIPIRVVVVPAAGPQRQADPIVWFAGGPGDSAVDTAAQTLPTFSSNSARDLVFIEQRGTGASNVTCPAFPSIDNKPALRASVESCLHQLKADLRFYTTAMFVDDVNEVLSDLHYTKVNLVGISYGTMAEQVFLMRHPQRVRTMTLLSGAPLNVPVFEQVADSAQRALDNVFSECENEPSCHRAFPHLGSDWAALWRSVNASPWVVPAKLSPSGKPLVLDADLLASAMHGLLMQAQTQTGIPLIVHLLASTKDRTATIVAIARGLGSSSAASPNQMLTYAIRCNEPWARDDPSAQLGAGSFEYHYDLEIAKWWQYVCPMIPKAGAASGPSEPARSDVPVLALNGEEDPEDQPSVMAGAKALWPNSLELAVPDQGHNTYMSSSVECNWSLMESFIEQGSAAQLDTSCLAHVAPASFALTLAQLGSS